MSRVIITIAVGTVSHQNIKMWGRMCFRSSSYSSVVIVTTGVGTRCPWSPLEEALKAAWGQQIRLPGGADVGRLPPRQTMVDKVGKEVRGRGSMQRE